MKIVCERCLRTYEGPVCSWLCPRCHEKELLRRKAEELEEQENRRASPFWNKP